MEVRKKREMGGIGKRRGERREGERERGGGRRQSKPQTPFNQIHLCFYKVFSLRYCLIDVPTWSPQAACDPARLNTQLITKTTYLKHKQLCNLAVKP